MFQGSSQAPWYDGLFPYAFIVGYAVFLVIAAVMALLICWRIYRLLGLHIKLATRRLDTPGLLDSQPGITPPTG